jgi:hypothetical protein
MYFFCEKEKIEKRKNKAKRNWKRRFAAMLARRSSIV